MGWSYSGNPSASDLDEVRFLVQDTTTTDQLVSDEEIAYAVAEEGSNLLSAVRIANAIAINFGRKADKAVGDLNITYSKQQENYLAIAKELKARGAISSGGIFSGGETISGKDSEKDDTDRVRPAFTKGAHDHPGGESKGDIDYTD